MRVDVDKAFLVEYADALTLQVVTAVVGVDQLAIVTGVEADGHGVDGEVAAGEVVVNGAGGNCRQSPRFFIGFTAGSGQVNIPVLPLQLGGVEAGVGGEFALIYFFKLPGQLDGVALNDQVEVEIWLLHEQVADDTADQVELLPAAVGHLSGHPHQVDQLRGKLFFD